MKTNKLIDWLNGNWALFLIIIVAAVLRLWKLESVPPHLTPDEASLGYNAYSILKTGKDEYGKLLPIIFKSFGDYKPGLYVYLTVPFVALLGLTEFAVRLPSALAGVVAVWLVFEIAKLIFPEKKGRTIGLAASFLLAISPWHIHFSRGAWEVNVTLTLTLAGMYLFLRSFKQNKLLIGSAILFALTLLTYQGAKFSTAIVIFVLAIVYIKEIRRFSKGILTKSLIVVILIALPIIVSFFQGRTGRLRVFSVFSYQRPTEELQLFLDQGGETLDDLSYSLFHSEGLNFARGIMGRWFNHFSTRFLFFQGDWQNPRHSAPNHGVLLLVDIVLLISGFAFLIRKNGRASVFIFLWLVLSPLPAVLSRDQVHAVRALNMVIPLTLISASGLINLTDKIRKMRYKTVLSGLLVILYFVNYLYYLDAYYIHLPVHNARHWFFGYKQAVREVGRVGEDYDRVIFQQSYDQPYIYFLFYNKVDPNQYHMQTILTESKVGDVGIVEKLGKVEFRWMSWPVSIKPGELLVADSVVVPTKFVKDNFEVLKEIKYPDNLGTAFRVMEMK